MTREVRLNEESGQRVIGNSIILAFWGNFIQRFHDRALNRRGTGK